MENNYTNLRDYKKQIETINDHIVADVYLGDVYTNVYANETDRKLAKVTELLDEAAEILADLLIDKTICPGDEVVFDGKKYMVVSCDLNKGYPTAVLIDSEETRYVGDDKICDVTKTGKHFETFDKLSEKLSELNSTNKQINIGPLVDVNHFGQ